MTEHSEQNPSSDNRRAYIRVPAAAIVEITPHNGGKAQEVESLDLSSGGILFNSNHQMDVGSRWSLRIRLDKSAEMNPDWYIKDFDALNEAVLAVCEVVRIKGSDEIGFEVAARFVSIEGDATQLTSFLEELGR